MSATSSVVTQVLIKYLFVAGVLWGQVQKSCLSTFKEIVCIPSLASFGLCVSIFFPQYRSSVALGWNIVSQVSVCLRISQMPEGFINSYLAFYSRMQRLVDGDRITSTQSSIPRSSQIYCTIGKSLPTSFSYVTSMV